MNSSLKIKDGLMTCLTYATNGYPHISMILECQGWWKQLPGPRVWTPSSTPTLNQEICSFISWWIMIPRFKNKETPKKSLIIKQKKAQYTFLTPREIERHAAKVYTSTLFYEVQKEIHKGAWFYSYSNAEKENGWEVYKVQHNNKNSDFKNKFKVI